LQGIKVDEATAGLQVWAKLLMGNGKLAVLLLNRTNSSAPISVHWSTLGLDPSAPVTVRDLWAHKDLGPFTEPYTATVAAGDVVMLTVKGKQGEATRYDNPISAKAATQGGSSGTKAACPSSPWAAERSLTFQGVTSAANSAFIQIAYTNGDKTPRLVELRVDGRIATRIALPPTGGDRTAGSVTTEAPLETAGSNALTFTSPCAAGPGIAWIAVTSGPHEYKPPL
jgi:alpha-galactosidase